MAGTSPRRSSRAKAIVPPLAAPPQSSTSSTNSSVKPDRKNKVSGAQGTNAASTTPETSTEASSEQEHTEDAKRQTRNNKQTGDAAVNSSVKEDNAQDEGDEGGSIRCLCRKSDYPGPPLPSESNGRNNHTKDDHLLNDLDPNDYSEEAGGLFIACDSCLTWQHGGCVGIFGHDMIPKDDYYCWRCRKDLHKLFTGAKGRRYSRYLPATEAEAPKTVRKQSFHREAPNRSGRSAVSKSNRSNGENQGEKRRSTMNSRSAWDEDEILRRALEESRGMSHHDGSTNGTRKGKRPRDDSNDDQKPTKRLKTTSDTDSSQQPLADETPEAEEQEDKLKTSTSRRARATTGQVQQDTESRQREKEKERERVEAANKRKGRAERRRADESEPPEERSKPTPTSKTPGTATKSTRGQQSGKQPLPTSSTVITSTSHKKASRAAGRKGKVGRNQYTRDRDAIADARAESGRVYNSREGEESNEGQNNLLSNGSKPSKPRHMNINRTSMNEIRKRAAGIFEYLSSTQVAMAGEKTPSDSSSPPRSTLRPGLFRGNSVNGASKLSNEILGDEPESSNGKEVSASVKVDEAAFRKLSSLEMMDVIAREIVLWQKDFGKYGEK